MKVVIIGGGASGVAAAIRIKQNNQEAEVLILEHLSEILKKIHATGNGRCNVTNRNAEHYIEVANFLESLGLILREDTDGRMYPYSNQAGSVVDILTNACKNYGIQIKTDCTIKRIDCFDGTFYTYTNNEIIESDRLILATGGKSQAPLGSDGSGYALAKQLGHSTTALYPALVQLKSTGKLCRQLKGTRVKCNVKIETNGEIKGEDFGELLFTDYGISGIVVMNLSYLINDERLKNSIDRSVAILDLVPEMSEDDLVGHYNKFGSFSGILPQKICSTISRQGNDNPEMMAKCIKNQRIIISGTKGYDFAQITGGGICDDEIDENNQSKIVNGLYIIGELQDKQFECGGFNLNYAIYSGIKTADNI